MKALLSFIIFMAMSITIPNKGRSNLLEDKAELNLETAIVEEEICVEEEIMVIAPENLIYREFHVLHPAFRNKIIKLFVEAKKQGIDLVVSETYRTPERQNKFRRMGLSKLRGGKSKHQFGLAIDLIPVIDSVSQHKNHEVLKRVGVIGEKLGLRWGGRWKRLYDPVHFEWDCKISDLENGWRPEMPDTILIPSENFFYKPLKIKK